MYKIFRITMFRTLKTQITFLIFFNLCFIGSVGFDLGKEKKWPLKK